MYIMSTGEYANGTTAIGQNALSVAKDTSSRDNSAFGINALASLDVGTNECSAFGAEALKNNHTGENTAVGAYASSNVVGTRNTSIGNWALRYNASGDNNTAVGHRTLAGTLTESDPVATPGGDQNTAVGAGALRGNNNGNENTAVGFNASYNNIDADYNTSIGSHALELNTLGEKNVAVGYKSGNTVTTEANNTLVGSMADIMATVTYGTAVGADSIVEQSNSVVLGRKPTGSNPAVDYVGIGTSAPVAALQVNGGHANRIRIVTALVDLPTIDDYILIVNTSAAASIVLPSGIADGHTFIVKNIGLFPVTLSTIVGGTDFYDTAGVATIVMPASTDTMTLVYSTATGGIAGVLYYVVAH